MSNYEPELNATLAGLVFGLSVWRNGASPGSTLLNLRFRNEHAVQRYPDLVGKSGVGGPGLSTAQKLLYGSGVVLFPYFWSRLWRALSPSPSGNDSDDEVIEESQQNYHLHHSISSSRNGNRLCNILLSPLRTLVSYLNESQRTALRRITQRLERLFCFVHLLNALAFLADGRFRTPLERILNIRLVYQRAQMTRLISFDLVSQQLIGTELTDLASFIIPLIDLPALRRRIHALLPSPTLLRDQVLQHLNSVSESGERSEETGNEGEKNSNNNNYHHSIGDNKNNSKDPLSCSSTIVATQRKDKEDEGDNVDKRPQHSQKQRQHYKKKVNRLSSSTTCTVCGQGTLSRPYLAMPCSHPYCYFCLAANCQSDPDFSCPLDGIRVQFMERAECDV
eukprot:CAMPEP_0175059264 /NCGR_PEP_ID=MMETSP0052_2-20121109/12334_1 /TAXON_ID=51329 ORGANISM="Polytomella parva, Strain SAG 63-3" /NCGR_SAMPLE_ID=MMETSP0052_2 /ASSEMBLY_ACC=CAM_ASM_000194 /LENGTH=392 /DNA_ID=CAMNT_0016324791 /DNA_START=266 /DNA_END=1444 /DNA_ORIENTATION=+